MLLRNLRTPTHFRVTSHIAEGGVPRILVFSKRAFSSQHDDAGVAGRPRRRWRRTIEGAVDRRRTAKIQGSTLRVRRYSTPVSVSRNTNPGARIPRGNHKLSAEFAESFPATFAEKMLILRIVNYVAQGAAKRCENSANSASRRSIDIC